MSHADVQGEWHSMAQLAAEAEAAMDAPLEVRQKAWAAELVRRREYRTTLSILLGMLVRRNAPADVIALLGDYIDERLTDDYPYP